MIQRVDEQRTYAYTGFQCNFARSKTTLTANANLLRIAITSIFNEFFIKVRDKQKSRTLKIANETQKTEI